MNTHDAHQHGNILIVDDGAFDLKHLLKPLAKAGHQVRLAGDSELALSSAQSKLPDLILLDFNLPGMNGVEICKQLKADPKIKDIPVIFISALGKTDLKVKALEAGAVDYITKPIEPMEVLARIKTHLNMYRLQRKLADKTEKLNTIIEEYKQTQGNLLESEEQFRLAFDKAAIGMGLLCTNGRWLRANPAFCDMLGYTESELLEFDFQAITHKDDIDLSLEYMKQAFEGTISTFHIQKRYIRKDGKIIWVNLSVSLIRNSNDEPLHFISQIENITERKGDEEKLKEYADGLERSNELKVLFADIMRHDLLNPVGIVQGYTEMLLDMEDNEKKINFLQLIEKHNNKLIDLIEETVKFTKLESVEELEFGEEDLAAMFKIVVDSFRPQIKDKQITLEFKAEGTYSANVNPIIEEVFANLLSNAIKYSPEKSKVIVDIIDAGENWKVTVTDFGEGVLDEHKAVLFNRFQRVNKIAVKGSGLGLAIVKRIIELHGGEVGVEDNPDGVGSVFWVIVGKV